jgi:hypothetical protein
MTSLNLNPSNEEKAGEGMFRIVSSMARRYSRDPATRTTSSRHLLIAAINLYAGHTSPGEAALMAAEAIADLAASERREGNR